MGTKHMYAATITDLDNIVLGTMRVEARTAEAARRRVRVLWAAAGRDPARILVAVERE